MPTILLVRHGQGSFGSTDYDNLSALGVQQAMDTHAHYRPCGGEGGFVLTAGGLRRQRDTAAPWLAGTAGELGLDPRWDEYDSDHILGAYADRPITLNATDGREQLPPRVFQEVLDGALGRWIDDPHAGVGSWDDFRRRSLDALDDLRGTVRSGQTAVAFTSGGVIAVCVAAILGVADHTFLALNRSAVNTGVTKILEGRNGLTLVSFNAHEHLPPGRVTFR